MPAKYILRLDDAHPGMHHEKWTEITNICNKFDISPIVAVIPDNKDQDIDYGENDADFWNKVLVWQQSGWAIAMHGYRHVLRRSEKGLVPINNYSEFTDLSKATQVEFIKKGLAVFQQYGIKPKLWVAPAHGMDINTVNALLESSINVVSDGFSFRGYKRYGVNWIPQQLWRGRKMKFGTWTICLHPSEMTNNQIDMLVFFIKNNSNDFVSIDKLNYKKYSILDYLFNIFFRLSLKIKKLEL